MSFGVDNVKQSYDVGVAHLLEQGDFADGGAGYTLVLGFETDLLQCDDSATVG